MISPCAACGKPVYPTEKLNCLDRVWHKSCFKCQECGMTLNMKNYKGFEKKPYCMAHYPKVKFTQVAETPENKRLKENSDANSKAKYTAEFQKQKGTKISTSVANDVSTLRLKQVQEQTSHAAYHKKFNEEIKGSATATTGDIKGAYLKDLQNLTGSKYQEEYKKKIIGTKTSVADDLMASHLKDAQTKISGIGYKQKTVSGSSRPTSMISDCGSVVLEDEPEQIATLAQSSSENDSGFEEPSSLPVLPTESSISTDPDMTPIVNHESEDDVFTVSDPETQDVFTMETKNLVSVETFNEVENRDLKSCSLSEFGMERTASFTSNSSPSPFLQRSPSSAGLDRDNSSMSSLAF
uniref:LASP class LIM protein ML038835b n=1 Tax=Mnemiopsis leidyi TaxID=27923 RepID=H2DJX3_MNELE|nr:LASP class LIM protein ML038835b [Mnemiopsis leidyi]